MADPELEGFKLSPILRKRGNSATFVFSFLKDYLGVHLLSEKVSEMKMDFHIQFQVTFEELHHHLGKKEEI